MPEVKRTLVKSGPELWAEISDPAALARHLGPFGSVRIAHAEPEHLLRWEGDLARGTVLLEPSGFGTRVILTADAATPEPEPAPPPPEPEPEPAGVGPAPEPVKLGFWARLFKRRKVEPVVVVEPEPEPEPAPAPEPVAPPEPAIADETIVAVLTETLDALGTAHHRPFSRV